MFMEIVSSRPQSLKFLRACCGPASAWEWNRDWGRARSLFLLKSKSPDNAAQQGKAAYVKIMILPNHRTTRLIRLREPPFGAEAEARSHSIGLA